MTKSEIALARLDALINERGYNFPEFLELSRILFAPLDPPIAAQ